MVNCLRCKAQITKKRMIPYREDFNEAQKKAWETMKNMICVECAKEYKDAGALHKLKMAGETITGIKHRPTGSLEQVKASLKGLSPSDIKRVKRLSRKKLISEGVSEEDIDEAFRQAEERP